MERLSLLRGPVWRGILTIRPGSGALTTCLVFSAASLAVACGSALFPDREPTLEGEIVGVGSAVPFGGPRTVWVKSTPDAPCGIVFRVEPRTEIGERQPDGSVEEREFEDLALGQSVRVWAGAVAESCPGQAIAEAVEIRFRVEIG